MILDLEEPISRSDSERSSPEMSTASCENSSHLTKSQITDDEQAREIITKMVIEYNLFLIIIHLIK